MLTSGLVLALLTLPVADATASVQGQQTVRVSADVRVIVTTLEGTVRLPGVAVELRAAGDDTLVARTLSDATGEVLFPAVEPGQYLVRVTQPGFVLTDSAPFEARPNRTTQVLLDAALGFVAPAIEVRAPRASPTDSVQPVAMSDVLAGSLMQGSPIEGDDFQSLLPLLPGTLRGPDGRLRIRGGQPSQAALQVSSASVNDPSTGDFDLELPAPSIQSVEVLANPFAAEYGRFSTSVTQVRTRSGTNEWEFKPGNLVPRFRRDFSGVRRFEPRLSLRGPLQRDRTFLAADLQFRHVATPVRSLPDEPEVRLRSFDSFIRLDRIVSTRHRIGGVLITFPRSITHATMNTFRLPSASPDFHQSGWSGGFSDRLAISGSVVETTLAVRRFEVEVSANGEGPMVIAPAATHGPYFNDQERDVTSVQWVQAFSRTYTLAGEHVVKLGTDLQWSTFRGTSVNRPVEIRRADGTLAERIHFVDPTTQNIEGTEFALFAQDRWRVTPRMTLELGLRMDRDAVVEGLTWSPRAGVSIALLPEGQAILRGGFGAFAQRTPLNIGAFTSYSPRVLSRFMADGSPSGAPVRLVNTEGQLDTPKAHVGNIEWNQRFARRLLLKVAFLYRRGSKEFLLTPDPAAGQLRLASTGTSRYRELEGTVRYLGGARRDLTVSYVWARSTGDLNSYDQFYGNFRDPVVRPNERSLGPTDVRHRLLLRGNIGLPGNWDLAPVIELRSGFPWTAVDDYRDVVGRRNLAGRLPAVHTVDLQLTRPWRVKGYSFRAGIALYNAFGASARRDIQNVLGSADFGRAFNPIERSIGFILDASR